MRTRQRESESVLVGMLLLYCLVFFLAAGCDRNPLGGCPPGFDAVSAPPEVGPATVVTPGGISPPQDLSRNLFCIVFPVFCRSFCPPDPLDPLYAWGGPKFSATSKQVPALARWHNDCLTAWRTTEHNAEAMLDVMVAAAEANELGDVLDADSRQLALEMFQLLLDGAVTHEMLPTHADIMAAWHSRPAKGAFAQDERLGRLLENLADGIEADEVVEWGSYAHSLESATVREYWVVSCMAASVAWWHDFSQEVGEDCSMGVFADLAAMQNSQDWHIVGIASLAGALVDVITHFWPQE